MKTSFNVVLYSPIRDQIILLDPDPWKCMFRGRVYSYICAETHRGWMGRQKETPEVFQANKSELRALGFEFIGAL